MTTLLLAGFAGLIVGSLVVAGFFALRRPAKAETPRRPTRVDPDKAAREADLRRQQILLAELTRRLRARKIPEGLWTPRGTNPVTDRSVLEFERWRPPDADGKRRSRRRNPDAPFEGPVWPYILSVDLHGLSVDDATATAEAIVGAAEELDAGRVRIVTGHGKRRESGESPVREAVLEMLRSEGRIYVEHAGHVDVSVDGSPV